MLKFVQSFSLEEVALNRNFVNQIEGAETEATAIVEAAKAKAKNMVEESTRELDEKLEAERRSLEIRLRDEKLAAEQAAEKDLQKSVQDQQISEISDEKQAEAVDKVFERIVTLLGNS